MAGDTARDFVSFAHSKAGVSKDGWHPLEAHLKGTAELAAPPKGEVCRCPGGWGGQIRFPCFRPTWATPVTRASQM